MFIGEKTTQVTFSGHFFREIILILRSHIRVERNDFQKIVTNFYFRNLELHFCSLQHLLCLAQIQALKHRWFWQKFQWNERSYVFFIRINYSNLNSILYVLLPLKQLYPLNSFPGKVILAEIDIYPVSSFPFSPYLVTGLQISLFPTNRSFSFVHFISRGTQTI